MNRFVPYEKLSKKAKRTLDALQRRQWTCDPAARQMASKKTYKRHPKHKGTGGSDAYD